MSSPMSSPPFSARAWARAQPWYRAILDHPFVRELGDGTLDRDVFVAYIVDDAHYLARFSRALATVASRWPEPAGAAAISRFAAGAVDAEMELHTSVLAEAGLDVSGTEPTPTCLAYANTLQADASLAPVEVAMAGLLPCFRIYAEVGQHLAEVLTSRPDHPYAAWLTTYGDPVFAEDTRRAEELVDQRAPEAGAPLEAMHTAYARATRFEWMFWDAAYRREEWPTPDGG